LIDCGDMVQGTLAASLSNGMAGMTALHLLGYDVFVPGNHEFDFGLNGFRMFTRDAGEMLLCGNLSLKGEAPFPAWRMFERDGVRIAVIGLAPSFLNAWLLPVEADRLVIVSGTSLLKKVLPDILAAKPDAIVVATHQGWFYGGDKRGVNEVNEMAESFPEIDLILGGHTHRLITGTRIGSRTWYCQAEAHASRIGVITLTVDTERHAVTCVSSMTMPVEASAADDKALSEGLGPFLKQEAHEWKRRIDGRLGETVKSSGIPGVSCGTSELLSQAIAWYTKAEVAFHGRLSKKDLPKGILDGADLYMLVPYDNRLVVAELTQDELEAITAEQMQWKSHYAYSPIWGARMRCKKDSCTMIGLGKDGTRLPLPGQRITVVFNNHTAAGSGRFTVLRKILEQPESKTRLLDVSVRKVVEEYINAHSGVVVTPFIWMVNK